MFKLKPNFATLGANFFNYVQPKPLANVKLVHLNLELQNKLGLAGISASEFTALLGGSYNVSGYRPLASVYAGHQFGVFVPQLGDGRAMLIAEHEDKNKQIWEFQLKGAGPTPYSRQGDGRAVLRSTLREYVACWAMARLKVPTTLALAMVDSETSVYREQVETGAVILRVAPSFIRFGHFEYFACRGQDDALTALAQFVVKNYYPHIDYTQTNYIPELLQQVVKNTAYLLANWQAVGFVHGVMNSDNMSILALTLDYGPYAFMDKFMPYHAYNHSDHEGRYTYAQQVDIGWWNLYRLAEALAVIYPDTIQLEQILASYADYYNTKFMELIAAKLGLPCLTPVVSELSQQLFRILHDYHMDWTFSWRQLSYQLVGQERLIEQYNLGDDFRQWYHSWQQQLRHADVDSATAARSMQLVNPAMVPRNHLLEQVISQAQAGNYSELNKLLLALSDPFTEHPEFSYYYQLPPTWAEQISLSCSS